MSTAQVGTRHNLPGRTIFATESGDGVPLILLHGITANAYVWAPIQARLAQRFKVVALDQRGHGRSDAPAGYQAAHYADDITGIIHDLGKGPAFVVGHSLGARNAICAAAESPALIRGIVAIDFFPFIEGEVFDSLESRVNGGARSFPSLDAVKDYLRDRYKRLPEDAIERRATYGYRSTAQGYQPLAAQQAMTETCVGLRAPLQDALARLAVPALLMRGADSLLVSPAAFAATKRLRPDLPAVEVDGADHYVPEEQPEAVSRLIMSFFADTPQPTHA
jgi:2-(acetamidomethylene)succinate hydrolase